jgi:hypothetical protein
VELVRRGATAAVLRLLQRGLRSADAVSATPTGRQLHPEDLKTLLELLQSLTGDAGAIGTAGVRHHVLAVGQLSQALRELVTSVMSKGSCRCSTVMAACRTICMLMFFTR